MRRRAYCEARVVAFLSDIRRSVGVGGGTKAARTSTIMKTRMLIAFMASGMLAGCLTEHRPRIVEATYEAHCPEGYYREGRTCYERHPVRTIVVEVTRR